MILYIRNGVPITITPGLHHSYQ